MKRLTSISAAAFTAAFLTMAINISAQDFNVSQRTFFTFSAPVQMPGVTLPAGKYVFRLADTGARNVLQVFDGEEKDIIGQWFFVPKQRTPEEAKAAGNDPVVTFLEAPGGMTPAVRYYFYPNSLTGREFIYPREQALKIAAATKAPVLATDTDVKSGGEAQVFTVQPSDAEKAADTRVEPAAPSAAAAAPASAPSTDNNRAAGVFANREQTPTGTSGAFDRNPEPRQQAAAELPRTASPLQLIGLVGLMALASGFGLRLARTIN